MSRAHPPSKRGLTILEIVGLCAVAVAFLYMLYAVLMRRDRPGGPTSPYEQSVRAAYYVAGRLRRDITWARQASIQRRGTRLILEGPAGEKRVYDFAQSDHALDLPQALDPTRTGRYQHAKFRKVLFLQPEPHLIKYVIAAYPRDRKVADRPTRKDREMTIVVAGEGWLSGVRDRAVFPYWNP